MADRLYDYIGDPFNNDAITEYKKVDSAYYSGNYGNITAPASPNYPINTPARYFIKLPLIPYTEDYATYPMTLRDVTGGVNLTRVTGTPNTNQYRVAPNTSRTPDIIELNSSQAGKSIGYSYYGIGSVLHTDNESDSYLTDIQGYNIQAQSQIISNGNWTETILTSATTHTINTPSILTNYKKMIIYFECNSLSSVEGFTLKVNGITSYKRSYWIDSNGYSDFVVGWAGGSSSYIAMGTTNTNSRLISKIELSLVNGQIFIETNTTGISSLDPYLIKTMSSGVTTSTTQTDINNITISTTVGSATFSGRVLISVLKI